RSRGEATLLGSLWWGLALSGSGESCGCSATYADDKRELRSSIPCRLHYSKVAEGHALLKLMVPLPVAKMPEMANRDNRCPECYRLPSSENERARAPVRRGVPTPGRDGDRKRSRAPTIGPNWTGSGARFVTARPPTAG